MTNLDACDFAGCQLNPEKTVALRNLWGMFSRFNEDRMDLCGKHYMEVLNWLYAKSNNSHLSELITEVKKEKSE